MRLSVLGGWGAFPPSGGACSGYVLDHDGFTVVLDPGYATFPRLLGLVDAGAVDAVLVTHGHPDHCADLNPLLRARVLADLPSPPLPLHAPPGALGPVLALDVPRMLAGSYVLHEFAPGESFELGPFEVTTVELPHFVLDAGLRLSVGGRAIAYTGDCGPSRHVVELARDADLLLAEATFAEAVPARQAGGLSTALDVAGEAAAAGVGHLVLTHLWPGTDPDAARNAAAPAFPGRISVASEGLAIEVR